MSNNTSPHNGDSSVNQATSQLIEIEPGIGIRDDVVVVDFDVIGPKGHPSHYNPSLFRPGECRNPGGRPKLKLLSKAYRNLLAAVNPETGHSYAEDIAQDMIAVAMERSRLKVQAASEIADRTEGRSRQTVEIGIEVSLASRIQRARKALMEGKTVDVRAMSEG